MSDNRLSLSPMAPTDSVFAPSRGGDGDLVALQEVRDLLGKARAARLALEDYDQAATDRIVEAMVEAGVRHSFDLAKLAVAESGFGVVAGKTLKNLFSTEFTWQHIKDMKTVGVINRDDERRVYEIAHPAGTVAAVIPITNPTSTAMFKCIIALKARCSIVVSPHPRGVACIYEACKILYEAALRAGAPEGCISCLTKPTLQSTNELMRHRWTSLILATGGAGLVTAAYSSGKPAFGVGPGNSPAYVDRSADPKRAARALTLGQVFDNGTICSSEQSIVLDRPIANAFLDEMRGRGAHICTEAEVDALRPVIVEAGGGRQNPDIVGQYPRVIAEMAGFQVPHDTTTLICPERGVGRGYELSYEKLSPVLALYAVDGWKEGLAQAEELLHFGGMGHSSAIHATDERVIFQMAERLHANRIMVNSPTTQGAIGYTTGLFPSMMLGCGTPGGNVVSDNIGPQHLINTKRLTFVRDEMLDENERNDISYRRQAGDTQLPWASSVPTSGRGKAEFVGAGGSTRPWSTPLPKAAEARPVRAAGGAGDGGSAGRVSAALSGGGGATPATAPGGGDSSNLYRVAPGGVAPTSASRERGAFGSVLPLTERDIETIISRASKRP